MFYVYVLKSQTDNKLYIGRSKDLKRRLSEHNAGLSIATKNRRPFDLIYYEAYKSQKDAIIRENRIKQFKNGYTELKKRIENSLI
jgi:putative endonuclease